MGVKDLWPILDSTAVTKPLSSLKGKRVAIDLGFWIVQSKCVSGLSRTRKPHLRNLFHRVSHLLTNGIMPIFVMDGKPPSLKSVTIRKRLKKETQGIGAVNRSNFNYAQKECQQLLNCLGLPCIVSSGEAEALCAFLNAQGVVDGCITDDNDTFLYGAKTVYRDFSSNPSDAHVKEYKISEIEKELGLNREKLIALALLLGCDYVEGVPSIGKETAMKLLKEIKCNDIFQRFKEWKILNEDQLFPMYKACFHKISHCTRCGHPGKHSEHKQRGCISCDSKLTCYLPKAGDKCTCEFHKNVAARESVKTEWKVYQASKDMNSFPNAEVIDEYLTFTDQVPNDEKLCWTKPDLSGLQNNLYDWLEWTQEYFSIKTLPVITSWQIAKLVGSQSNVVDCKQFYFEPIRILKIQTKQKKQFYKVLWRLDADEVAFSEQNEENMCTLEDTELFSKAYKNIVDTFLKSEEEKKRAAEEKKSRKKNIRTRKILSSPVATHKVETVVTPKPNIVHLENIKCLSPPIMEINTTPKMTMLDSFLARNLSLVDSESSFIDLPLTQRMQFKALVPRNKRTSVVSPCQTPLMSQYSPLIDNLEVIDNSRKSLTSIRTLKDSPVASTPFETYLENISPVVNMQTPKRLLLYSVKNSTCGKEHLTSGIRMSTPDVIQSSHNYADLLTSFQSLKLDSPIVSESSYDASADLFLSSKVTSQLDDSVICLN